MKNKKYKIKCGDIGSTSLYNIICEGNIVCSIHGPMSGAVALAAVEHLNTTENFWNGCFQRLYVECDENEDIVYTFYK